MKLLWLSTHKPFKNQLEELNEIFDEDVEIVVHRNAVKTGAEVVQIMKRNGADEVCAVLPINLIEEIVDLGVQPIRAHMERIMSRDGVTFAHLYFYKVIKLDIVREIL
jgi:hypothetical protein